MRVVQSFVFLYHMQTNTVQQHIGTAAHSFGKPLFYGAIALAGSAAIVYMFFIAGITSNIVARKAYEKDQKTVQSEISGLELSYLSKIQSLDEASALAVGLAHPKEVYFASRLSKVGFLTEAK